MLRKNLARLLTCVLLLLLASPVLAREVLNSTDCLVEADEIIEGTLFVVCENLRISGTVNGDVLGGVIRGDIDGVINGNIYILATQLNITGTINEDIHFGGGVLRMNPPQAESQTPIPQQTIEGSLKSVALSVEIFENTEILGGVVSAGYQVLVYGDVRGEINFWGSSLVIDGLVKEDVYAEVGDPSSESAQIETLLLPLNLNVKLLNPGLFVSETGQIQGGLQYRGPAEASIIGQVDGATVYYPANLSILPILEEQGSVSLYIAQFIREITTLLAIGGIGLFIVPNLFRAPLSNLRTRPFASFSVGMLSFILSFPVVLIGLVLSFFILFLLQVIGLNGLVLAVAIVLALVNVGGMSLFYFLAIFVARALVGLAIGRFLLLVVFQREENRQRDFLALLLGLVVLGAFVSLPIVGLLFNAASLFLGLGTILSAFLDQFRRIRDTSPNTVPNWYTPSPVITREHPIQPNPPKMTISPVLPPPLPAKIPPPKVENYDSSPGMNNLPDGFDFAFFEERRD